MTDTRLSSAIHMLILIAGAEKPMTSEQIARSVGTNASYIRKLAGLLKKQGVIESRRGVGGFRLLVPPEELSLLRVYRAVAESERVRVFELHQNPSDRCVVGRHIRPVLTDVFRDIEQQAERELKTLTLSDCMQKMRMEMEVSHGPSAD